MTLAIAIAIGTGPVALAYDPAYPDLPPLEAEVLGKSPTSPMLVIDRLKAIDNMDANIMTADRADFYAVVIVNDIQYKTGIMAMDYGSPDWQIPLPTNVSRVNIKIRIFDEDGGFEGGDDHVDISRAKDKKDLIFTYFPGTGRVMGDVNGWKGTSFYTRGQYDGDKAHIWFTIV
jgi:hypothetical protein